MKMKWLTWIAVLAVAGWLGNQAIRAEEVAAKAVKYQETCPVMKGEKINKKLFVDYEGKRIYVCCGGCIRTVKKDPAKYVKEMEAEGITLAPVPATDAKPVQDAKPAGK